MNVLEFLALTFGLLFIIAVIGSVVETIKEELDKIRKAKNYEPYE